MREGIDDKAFPEQGAKVSIHSDGSFEGLGCVLANTNLNVLTAVFYWFTLKRDEPKMPANVSRPAFRLRRGLFDAQDTAGIGGADGFHHVAPGDDHQIAGDRKPLSRRRLTASLAAITPSLWLSKYTGVTPRYSAVRFNVCS